MLCIWWYSKAICIIFGMWEYCLLNHVYIHSFWIIIEATEKFPGVGVFDHLEWTYKWAFEQRFGLERGNFPKMFQKFKYRGGGGCLSFALTGTLIRHLNKILCSKTMYINWPLYSSVTYPKWSKRNRNMKHYCCCPIFCNHKLQSVP